MPPRVLVEQTSHNEHVEIAVKGKDGLAYTIEGTLVDGFIWAGDPKATGQP